MHEFTQQRVVWGQETCHSLDRGCRGSGVEDDFFQNPEISTSSLIIGMQDTVQPFTGNRPKDVPGILGQLLANPTAVMPEAVGDSCQESLSGFQIRKSVTHFHDPVVFDTNPTDQRACEPTQHTLPPGGPRRSTQCQHGHP
jgi:hypothetical protein